MSIYRVVVDSSKRVSGTGMNNFSINIANTFTSRDFLENVYMCCVESVSLVMYSETSATFAGGATNPRALMVTCPQMNSTNAYESWRGMDDSATLVALQPYCTGNAATGVFGLHHDSPYCRKKHLGNLIMDERLQKSGLLNFVLYRSNSPGVNTIVGPCSTPNGTSVWGNDWTMTLVFFPVKMPKPEIPITPYYDYHKIWLNTVNRRNFGTTYPVSCEIPIRYSTHGAMSIPNSKWYINVEFVSPIFYSTGSLPACLYLTTTFSQAANNSPTVLCTLNRSYRAAEQGHFGVRYSIRPTARDHIGVRSPVTLDSLTSMNLALRDPNGALSANVFTDYMVCLTFYRQQ
jgi:hypothetical protein